MENVIANRRLRKSFIKDVSAKNLEVLNNISSINIKTKHNHNYNHNYNNDSESRLNTEEQDNFKISFKGKILMKIFIATLIVFLCLIFKLVYPNIIEQNKYIGYITKEYKQDYSREQIMNYIEGTSNTIYNSVKFLFPDKVVNFIKEKYDSKIKPAIYNFDLKESIKNLFDKNVNTQENISNENLQQENTQNSSQDIVSKDVKIEETGMGGGEPIQEEEKKEDASSLSTMDIDVNEILSKNINITKPVYGVITSRYGAREQIFEGVNPYHTGIDIANKLDTEIKSATIGSVKNIVNGDKYYGNYIEIETNGVIFKYAHLNSILVKVNDNVNQESVIGKMGSTGMSTGSHLHFEIKINNRSVDPENILKF